MDNLLSSIIAKVSAPTLVFDSVCQNKLRDCSEMSCLSHLSSAGTVKAEEIRTKDAGMHQNAALPAEGKKAAIKPSAAISAADSLKRKSPAKPAAIPLKRMKLDFPGEIAQDTPIEM